MYKEITDMESHVKAYEFVCADPLAVICVIHGIGEHFLRYERFADRLSRFGITTLGIDLRGHGNSEGKRGHCAPREAVLKDIDDLLVYASRKYPDLPLVLYGHSMGGNLVLDYRHRGDHNGLPVKYVVSAPWIKLVRGTPAPLVKVVGLLARIAPEMTISSAVDEKLLGNPASVGKYSEDPLVHSRISLATALDGYEIGEALYKGTWPYFGEGKNVPMLLMHGDADSICDVRGSRAVAANEGDICEYRELAGYYHEIHNGGPGFTGDEVIDSIGKWITGEEN